MFALRLLLACMLCVGSTTSAVAVPIQLRLESVTVVGGAQDSLQTYVPGFPITGSGDIDFTLGTGFLSLVDHAILIDVVGVGTAVDARIDVSGWGQTITSIDGLGALTSIGTGTYACPYPIAFCEVGPPANTGWPPADGSSASSALIDPLLQTITVVDNSNEAYTGTVTQLFSYTVVPEPGTAALFGGGLLALAGSRRPNRARTS